MKKLIFSLIISNLIFYSCGSSADELKQKEIIFQDSINKVKQAKDTLIVKQKIKEDSLLKVDNLKQLKIKHRLSKLNTTYMEECNKLEKLTHHKLFLSKHKKEEQIQKQTLVVESLKKQIGNLKNQIGN